MLTILLQAAGQSPLGGFLPLILLLLVMYFFFFRPQMKRQKDERKFREDMIKKGMRIVTNSGIHGKILEITDTTLVIESENSRLKIDRSAVSKELSAQYLPKEEKKEDKKEKDKEKK